MCYRHFYFSFRACNVESSLIEAAGQHLIFMENLFNIYIETIFARLIISTYIEMNLIHVEMHHTWVELN